ncbi:phage tail assembly protein T [Salininema proteolyticum]|uniref:DUF4035 domain-containing protein n=1 Tax=Salininema proteolyticum TaxID=1607685 RepID=A0ABV8TTK0_9ACTN
MRLALELGCSVRELLTRLTSAEITEWMAFERINGPLGGKRHDYNAALITKTIVDANSGKKRRRRKLTDFLLQWGGKRRRPQTGSEMAAKATAAFGINDERR